MIIQKRDESITRFQRQQQPKNYDLILYFVTRPFQVSETVSIDSMGQTQSISLPLPQSPFCLFPWAVIFQRPVLSVKRARYSTRIDLFCLLEIAVRWLDARLGKNIYGVKCFKKLNKRATVQFCLQRRKRDNYKKTWKHEELKWRINRSERQDYTANSLCQAKTPFHLYYNKFANRFLDK